MIAHPFPPYLAPGASIRLIKFLKYMVQLRPGWQIDVITVDDKNGSPYPYKGSASLLSEIPPQVCVIKVVDLSLAPQVEVRNSMSNLARNLYRQLHDRFPQLRSALRIARRFKHYLQGEAILSPSIWHKAVITYLTEQSHSVYDLVYISVPPNDTVFLGAMIKECLKRPLIVDIKDDWTCGAAFEHLPPEEQARGEALERLVTETADEVILVTAASLERFQRRYPSYHHFNLITNGVDLEDFQIASQVPSNALSKFLITHTGTLNNERDPACFFRAFRRLLDNPEVEASDCQILFLGSVWDVYQHAFCEMGLEPWVTVKGFVPKDEFERTLSGSYVLLTINYYGHTTLIPGKIYEYWATGRPILLLEKPGVATELLRKYELGYSADPDNPDDIYSALLAFYSAYKAGLPWTVGRDGLAQFGRETLTRQLCEVMERYLTRKVNNLPSGESK